MDTLLIQKFVWSAFQAVVVVVLLSGCGGGDGDAGGSSDASLSGLSLDGIVLDQTFQADQLNYSVSVDFSQDSITLTPLAVDTGATLRINGSELTSGTASTPIALAVGENRIDIVVTSSDRSTTLTYTIVVSRALASSGASLSDLGLASAMPDQLFQPSQTTYSASVGFLQASVTLTPITTDTGATIHVNGTEVTSGNTSAAIALSEGENTINLVVTAEDGVTTQHYSIEITRDDAASFAQQAFLKASNADGGYSQQHGYYGDQFGSSVAISGDTLVVGAPGRSIRLIGIEWNNSKVNFGAVYVFTRSDGAWNQQAYLEASNADAGDQFGASVAISGDTLVVGAIGEDSRFIGGEEDNFRHDAGAAYVFTRSDGIWSQQALLKPRIATDDDQFGTSVAISADTLAVGAPGEDSSANGGERNNSTPSAGAVYVFSRNDGIWSQQALIKASNAGEDDEFGISVAISGDTLVVGAPGEDSNAIGGEDDNSAQNVGAAYVFNRSGGMWDQQAYLKPSTASDGHVNVYGFGFGTSTAISGETLAVGYPSGNSLRGEAYIFTRSGGIWNQQAHLESSNDTASFSGDGFGISLALSGDTLVVGEPKTDQACIFTRNGGAWNQQTIIKGSNTENFDKFGSILAISGDTLVVGAPDEDSSATGGEADNSASNAGASYTWQ